ncbi:hypothetical protein IAQ61_003891 [Plenodomus lingam]|uniref:Similar to APSES transcription factor n=1 Tax=Leptosphaeria maculans (strain JN3 / isolate v23.1.3 / race Av1-4-5-6-7-8) TaxID=985895 RepID=E4ZQL2_LEPMJ|nr:similar to APSES transcription factor [Plenodomus lingam JN3]KAH9874701.1 hypothetical protein IAQ61_003891 [Plenodomus lingam]CBX94017.1 similar to APSES transcription factor [Plenodomus lingam JN3]
MVSKRALPERRNPLLEPTDSTAMEILVERRRLGQTNLAVKPGIAGVTSATKAENLGTFDYAHLRVPLPKDLSGSGIFTLNRTSVYPESYFLMRRSADGYVSATGMFKAAFPWASLREEEAERLYQKTFPSAGPDEVAGSVWIAPEEALALSEEYSMRHWIEALLDPAPIEKGNKDKHNPAIQGPPKFDVKNAKPVTLPPYLPSPAVRSTRARSTRSASPSKMATPSRKIATPRKPRTTRNAAKADKPDDSFESATPGSALQTHIANGATPSDSAASSINGDAKEPAAKPAQVQEGTFRVEVQETTETNGNVETTTTNVKLDVPHSHPELPEPEDPMKMIEEAKRMVAEAQALEAGSSAAGASSVKLAKRRIEDVVDAAELAEERSSKAAKVAYTTEQKLTKEKVTRRALVGLGVMAAIGTAFGYLA